MSLSNLQVLYEKGYTFADIPMGAHYHLLVGISANGYPVSDNRTLNCKKVVPSHIKGGKTVMGYPLTLTQCAPSKGHVLEFHFARKLLLS